MKRIMTAERFRGLHGEEEYREAVEECYQEVLDFVTTAIGQIHVSDEPLLCAALEVFARTLKANMREPELGIYEEIKKLAVIGFNTQGKIEE